MLYFIPWVVFLLLVILAVPIASMLEKRKHPKPEPVDEPVLDEEDGDPMAQEQLADDGAWPAEADPVDSFGGADPAGDASFEPVGDDAFAEFEDDFK